MDANGRVVQNENKAMGCKVKVYLDPPNLALVLDEVGCNISQELDNPIGGELFLTGENNKVYRSVSTWHHHLPVIGVTALSGEPVLCVVIIVGKRSDILIATGFGLE